jgi:hypothetical protein
MLITRTPRVGRDPTAKRLERRRMAMLMAPRRARAGARR